MSNSLKIALNADTTPLSIADILVFKSLEERAREAREAGFTAVNVNSGEPGLSSGRVNEILGENGLQVASGWFHGHFQKPEQEEEILRSALEQAEFSREIGQDCLFVSAFVSPPERAAVAGRVRGGEPASLTDKEFRQVARLLEEIARRWLDYGIQLFYHPHVATYIEAEHEIDRLMDLTNPDLVKLGPDTGHLLYGGTDPIRLIRKYLPRVGGLHIKDVRTAVIDRVRREGLGYRQACAAGVWTELGTGDVDFPALFEMLRGAAWTGWVIVETDHTQLETAVESSRVSRRYLHETFGL